MSRRFALLYVLAAQLSVQVGASAAKQLFSTFGPELTTLVRVGLSALILNIFWKPWRSMPDRRALGAIALYGLSLGAMNILFYLALARIPLGPAVAIEFTGPLAVAILSSRRKLDFAWGALATFGVLLLSPWSVPLMEGLFKIAPGSAMSTGPQLRPALQLALDPTGLGLALGAGFFWAMYIIFGKRAGRQAHGPYAVAIGMVFAASIALPFSIAHLHQISLTPNLIGIAFAVAVLSSALPYSLEMSALEHLPTQLFGILMSLEPAIGAGVGYVVLHERLIHSQMLAIALVMAASFGSACSQPEGRSPYEGTDPIGT